MGADIEGEAAYWQAFERGFGQLDWTAREPYDFAPLPAVEAERYFFDADGRRIGVKGIRPNCIYISACDPGESLLAVSQEEPKAGKVADADASMLWQLYEGRDEQALVLCAARGSCTEGRLELRRAHAKLHGRCRPRYHPSGQPRHCVRRHRRCLYHRGGQKANHRRTAFVRMTCTLGQLPIGGTPGVSSAPSWSMRRIQDRWRGSSTERQYFGYMCTPRSVEDLWLFAIC